MEWISVTEDSEIPTHKTIIVEDVNGWVGQAYFEDGWFFLETFGQIVSHIKFDKIIRYIIID